MGPIGQNSSSTDMNSKSLMDFSEAETLLHQFQALTTLSSNFLSIFKTRNKHLKVDAFEVFKPGDLCCSLM